MTLNIQDLDETQALVLKLTRLITQILLIIDDIDYSLYELRSKLPEPENLTEQYNKQKNGASLNDESPDTPKT